MYLEVVLFVCFPTFYSARLLLSDLVVHLLFRIPCRTRDSSSWHSCHDVHLLCSQKALHQLLTAKMSLAKSPDFQIRPEDKALDMFFPSEDPPINSFDDYLDENYDLSDGDNKETFDSFLEFFEKEATARGSGCLSPTGGSTKQEASPPQPWRKGLWCLNQNGASSPSSVIQDKSSSTQHYNGNAWNGREEFNHHKARGKPYTNFSRPVPRSPPHTPSHKGTKRVPNTSPRTARRSRHVPRTYSREGTLSPKSSYARNQQNSKMAYQESLQRHLQNFHLLAGDEVEVLSPPPSRRPRLPEYSAQFNAASVTRNRAITRDHALSAPVAAADAPYPSLEHGHAAVDVPYPSVEHGQAAVESGLDSVFYSTGTNTILSPHEQALNPADYLQDLQDQTNAPWIAKPLQPPTGAAYPYDLQAAYKYLGDMQQSWPEPWIASASQPDAPHSYQDQYPIIAAPTPQRPTHQLLQNPISPQLGGLGINFSETDSSTADHRAYHPLSPLEPAYSYPPLPEIGPEPIHTFEDASPFTTPRHHHHHHHPTTDLSPSRSTSPSISPTNTKYNFAATSRSLRQTSPTRPSARRKSIGAPKASSFPNSQQQHHHHHHSNGSTSNKAPRTPRTPRTPTGGGGGFGGGTTMDFVNFTPKDSAKLLNDVAPSGSSKTRARREQEARDKRRRLSEAAVKAVRRAAKAAGGNVDNGEVEAPERAILA